MIFKHDKNDSNNLKRIRSHDIHTFIQSEHQIGAQRNVLKYIFYSNENDYLFLQDVKTNVMIKLQHCKCS